MNIYEEQRLINKNLLFPLPATPVQVWPRVLAQFHLPYAYGNGQHQNKTKDHFESYAHPILYKDEREKMDEMPAEIQRMIMHHD